MIPGIVAANQAGKVSAPQLVESAASFWRASDYSGSGNLLDLSGNGFDLTLHANMVHQGDYFQATAGQGGTPAATMAATPAVTDEMTFVSVWGNISGTAGVFGDASENWSTTGWLYYLGVGPTLNADIFDSDFDPYYNNYEDMSAVTINGFSVAIRISPTTFDTLRDGVLLQSVPITLSWPIHLADSEFRIGASMPAGARFYGAAIFDQALTNEEIAQAASELGAL